MWTSSALALLSTFGAFGAINALGDLEERRIGWDGRSTYDDWIIARDAAGAFVGLFWLAWIAGFVVLLVWLHKAHTATQQMWPGKRKWGSGWTVGGWFIPLANMVIPKLVINEIERIATAPRVGGRVDEGWRRCGTSALGWVWWLALTPGIFVWQIGATITDAPETTPSDLRIGYWVQGLALLAIAIGLAAGAVFFRRLTRRFRMDTPGNPWT